MPSKEVTQVQNMHGLVEIGTCPFCGTWARCWVSELAGVPELEPDYYVMCDDCGAKGQSCETPHKAVRQWNNRIV